LCEWDDASDGVSLPGGNIQQYNKVDFCESMHIMHPRNVL